MYRHEHALQAPDVAAATTKRTTHMQVQRLIEGLIERQDRGAGSWAAMWAAQFRDAVAPGAEIDAKGALCRLRCVTLLRG